MACVACGEPREPVEPAGDSGAEGVFEDGGGVGPGVREVQDFTLPGRAAVSRQSFATTDPFEHLRFDDAAALIEAGGRFYVAERAGRIYAFEPKASVRDKTLVLDLTARTIAGKDSGLVAIAAHPEFGVEGSPNRGYLYVYYAYSEDNPGPTDSSNTPHELRLSRFTIPDGEAVADPSSELVLIAQRDRHLVHQGGGLTFGGDGFLYLGNGDEGGYDCRFKTCQRKDVLFSGVLRIDVDMRGGDISHPIRRQPIDGVTDHYFIPSDNPFVDDPDAMEELFAIGLRNPFRITHDPVDDLIWIGDVGQEQSDEIDILKGGENFQWDVLEGLVPAELTNSDPTLPRIGVWTDPLHAYERREMRAIVGGPVYRGARLPSLYGRYLHADFVKGNLWAASYAIAEGEVELIDTRVILETTLFDAEGGITAIMQSADGSVYMTSFAKERGLVGLEEVPLPSQDAPSKLSDTELFQDLEALAPAEGLMEYAIIAPLWSDGSQKRRFVAIPEGKRARFEARGSWTLPSGTVLVKHFAIALDEREPDALHKLETRVLVVDEDGIYGATYKWRSDQSDADLLLEHEEEELLIIDEDGEERVQTHIYPSPAECLRCHRHDERAGLGLATAQLNRPLDGVNQLRAWHANGLFENVPGDLDDEDTVDALPRHAALDDEGAPLEQRVRSYLEANCAHCHGGNDLHGARWDARSETPLAQANILDAPLTGPTHDETLRIVAPGAPERSQLYLRATSTDRARRMPPLGSSRPDPAFEQALRAWIESLD
jgi:uncharacterized repeat protein (TIGR03806 family)